LSVPPRIYRWKWTKGLSGDDIPKLALIVGIAEHIVLLGWDEERLRGKYADDFIENAIKISR